MRHVPNSNLLTRAALILDSKDHPGKPTSSFSISCQGRVGGRRRKIENDAGAEYSPATLWYFDVSRNLRPRHIRLWWFYQVCLTHRPYQDKGMVATEWLELDLGHLLQSPAACWLKMKFSVSLSVRVTEWELLSLSEPASLCLSVSVSLTSDSESLSYLTCSNSFLLLT